MKWKNPHFWWIFLWKFMAKILYFPILKKYWQTWYLIFSSNPFKPANFFFYVPYSIIPATELLVSILSSQVLYLLHLYSDYTEPILWRTKIIILTAITRPWDLNCHRADWSTRGGRSRLQQRKGSLTYFFPLPNNFSGFPQIFLNCCTAAQEPRQEELPYSSCVASCSEHTQPKQACCVLQCSMSEFPV